MKILYFVKFIIAILSIGILFGGCSAEDDSPYAPSQSTTTFVDNGDKSVFIITSTQTGSYVDYECISNSLYPGVNDMNETIRLFDNSNNTQYYNVYKQETYLEGGETITDLGTIDTN